MANLLISSGKGRQYVTSAETEALRMNQLEILEIKHSRRQEECLWQAQQKT